MGPDASAPSARLQQAKQFVAEVIGVSGDPVGLLPTPLGVRILSGGQLRSGDVISNFHRSLTVESSAANISDAARHDTLSCASVESPGVHVQKSHWVAVFVKKSVWLVRVRFSLMWTLRSLIDGDGAMSFSLPLPVVHNRLHNCFAEVEM